MPAPFFLMLAMILALVLPRHAQAGPRDYELVHALNDGAPYEAVETLLARGADPNAVQGMQRNTPLLLIARKIAAAGSTRYSYYDDANVYEADYLPIIRLLLNEGADINAADRNGETALTILSRVPALRELVEFLLQNGARQDILDSEGMTPLGRSIRSCNMAEISFWLSRNPAINAADRTRMTPLMHAVEVPCTDRAFVESLLAAGADINAVDRYGRNALLIALQQGKPDAAELLMARGADVTARDTLSDDTPLKEAIRLNVIDLAKLMVERGAKVNDTAEGDTPLLLASYKKNADLVEYLLSRGADPNARNRSGKTALQHAATVSCDLETMNVLLRGGAGSGSGKLASEAAASRCGEATAALLKSTTR